jgi:uncharacterized phage protein gp47/JayE
MAVTIPSITAIRDQILSDISARIGASVPILPKAAWRVLATALAGVLALLYRMTGWGYRQIFPQTADDAALASIGEQYGIIRTPAVAAKLTATATGTDGTNIPAGTFWTLLGLIYTQDALQVIASGTATIALTCLTPGSAGNIANGLTISVVSPISGMNSTATIASTTTTGVDAEALTAYRARVMTRMQNKPQGGAAADYVGWAREVAGIVKAFAFRTAVGYVTAYPLQAVTGASRIPMAGKITEVQTYLNDVSRRPLCANVLAAAMTERTVDFTITGLSPNDATTKAVIIAAITSYLYAAYPRQYIDELNPTDVLSVAAIWGIISAAGAIATAVTMTVSGIGTVTSYTLAYSELAAPGTVTWA